MMGKHRPADERGAHICHVKVHYKHAHSHILIFLSAGVENESIDDALLTLEGRRLQIWRHLITALCISLFLSVSELLAAAQSSDHQLTPASHVTQPALLQAVEVC